MLLPAATVTCMQRSLMLQKNTQRKSKIAAFCMQANVMLFGIFWIPEHA
jgi:hypothetical protein